MKNRPQNHIFLKNIHFIKIHPIDFLHSLLNLGLDTVKLEYQRTKRLNFSSYVRNDQSAPGISIFSSKISEKVTYFQGLKAFTSCIMRPLMLTLLSLRFKTKRPVVTIVMGLSF